MRWHLRPVLEWPHHWHECKFQASRSRRSVSWEGDYIIKHTYDLVAFASIFP